MMGWKLVSVLERNGVDLRLVCHAGLAVCATLLAGTACATAPSLRKPLPLAGLVSETSIWPSDVALKRMLSDLIAPAWPALAGVLPTCTTLLWAAGNCGSARNFANALSASWVSSATFSGASSWVVHTSSSGSLGRFCRYSSDCSSETGICARVCKYLGTNLYFQK